jgi:hypothetical protein
MHQTRHALSPREIEARRLNARKSTGPRTPAGKRRAALNALKYGTYTTRQSLAETLLDLGEDPREFERFMADMMVALEPAGGVERMLAEDIVMLAWKKRRLDRAQVGLQLRNLELLELERHRQALEVGRDSADVSQAEVIKIGLRRSSKSPAKFGEILSYLDMLIKAVEKNDFSQDADPIFTALYGEEPTLRGAQIINLYHRFQNPDDENKDAADIPDPKENRALAAGLKLALHEETRDVAEEYALHLQEHVHVSPALRNATLAPSNPEWRAMIRHEYTLDRLIERKLKLLMRMQDARQARELASGNHKNGHGEKRILFFKNKARKLLKLKDGCGKNGQNEPKTKLAMLLKTNKGPKNEAKTWPASGMDSQAKIPDKQPIACRRRESFSRGSSYTKVEWTPRFDCLHLRWNPKPRRWRVACAAAIRTCLKS